MSGQERTEIKSSNETLMYVEPSQLEPFTAKIVDVTNPFSDDTFIPVSNAAFVKGLFSEAPGLKQVPKILKLSQRSKLNRQSKAVRRHKGIKFLKASVVSRENF